MSEYEIEYCPWCGSDGVEQSEIQSGHSITLCRECPNCDRKFIVKPPTTRVEFR